MGKTHVLSEAVLRDGLLALAWGSEAPGAVPFRCLAFFSGSFTLMLGIATASVEALQRKCGKRSHC